MRWNSLEWTFWILRAPSILELYGDRSLVCLKNSCGLHFRILRGFLVIFNWLITPFCNLIGYYNIFVFWRRGGVRVSIAFKFSLFPDPVTRICILIVGHNLDPFMVNIIAKLHSIQHPLPNWKEANFSNALHFFCE